MKKIKAWIWLLAMLLGPLAVQGQPAAVSVSGKVIDKASGEALPFVTVALKEVADSSLTGGTITNERGIFTLADTPPGDYYLEVSYLGYAPYRAALFVGGTSKYINVGDIALAEQVQELSEVVVTGEQDAVSGVMDKKTYAVSDNVSQSGGSVLQSMSNLPGVTTQDGKVQLRGSDQVMVLIDGKQTAITGFGSQNGLENIPASAVAKIEIINNPSARYDANGNAGIINIVLKQADQDGAHGTLGVSTGLGALWVRQENLPGIRPQYQRTPKVNPSVSLNYRRPKVNLFLQADNLYTQTLNKNEFVSRQYDNGTLINQQLKRNRNTNFFTSKAGLDWYWNDQNTLTMSGFFSKEAINDYGDQPFFDGNTRESLRLWQFLEDEVLTAGMATVAYQHLFHDPGHQLSLGFNYTFDREDEKYFFTNTRPTYATQESFFLIADQKVADFTLDYTRPMRHGLLETGIKFRRRSIPTNMQFNPSAQHSVLDTGADGKARYLETIPAVYGNYRYEVKKLEAELGLRMEYVNLWYDVDPSHNTYQSDGYQYFQPFPSARLTYKVDDRNRLSVFYNRRVTRPDEVDIRIFPKYDDAEIIKVGNPALQPQFTTTLELGYKNVWEQGYLYGALYHRQSQGTITRVATTVDTTNLIYNISQNAGQSSNTGAEVVLTQDLGDFVNVMVNVNGYFNRIEAFEVQNRYPIVHTFRAEAQQTFSGNAKLITQLKYPGGLVGQISFVYLAPDIIPQGSIGARYAVDVGIKRSFQQGKGELFINATDLFNTLVPRKTILGEGFQYTSVDYYETQVIRLGYQYSF